MKRFLKKLWKDERGAEVVEWIIIVALIAGVAFAVYQGALKGALNNGVNQISNTITNAGK